MANDIANISAAIVTKLQGVSGLSAVYDYEPDKPSNGGYPFATVVLAQGAGKFGDTIRNVRNHTFYINLYQERTEVGFGNAKAERLIRSIADEILTAFDMDTTLSGTVKWVNPLQYDANYIDREIGDTRMAQFTVDCVTVVPSVT